MINRLSEKILKNVIKTFFFFSFSLFLLVLFFLNGFLSMLFLFLLIPFLFELFIVILFRVNYGKNFKYSFLSFLLIDHDKYGFSFRPNARFKEINFLLYDSFAFPSGSKRISDLEKNKTSRNIFNVNSLGFRGQEFSKKKDKDTLRVFCSGGSTTACDSNNDNQTWPYKLQEYLQDKTQKKIEVINAGVQGWYSYQELLRFKEEILNYDPDVLILHEGWNEEFEYSSLGLGTKWKPCTVRNTREANNLYCSKDALYSGTLFKSFYLLLQEIRKKYIFSSNMSFTNPKRWNVLNSLDYKDAWMNNLMEFATLAKDNNILMYTVDSPCLVNLSDSSEERNIYLKNSRLNSLFADYQSISKKIISQILKVFNQVVPRIDCNLDFVRFKGAERLNLFIDEIHLSAEGNNILANTISQSLLKDKAFKDLLENLDKKKSNIIFSKDEMIYLKQQCLKENLYLKDCVQENINLVENKKFNQEEYSVPVDRYTTF